MLPEETPRRNSFGLVAAAALFIVTAGYSIYLGFTSGAIKENILRLETKKETIAASRGDSAAGLRARILALQKQLTELEENQVAWSALVEKIEKTVPRRQDGTPIAFIRSYTGGRDAALSLSFITDSNSTDPFGDIASVIRAFATEPTFSDVFVPSINKTLTPEGATVASFGMTLNYTKRAAETTQ